jgi:hypothetical protein
VLKIFRRMLAERRRRRSLLIIRREFAKCGYPLDGLADADIEASLHPTTVEDPAYRLGAKTINRALRRLPLGTRRRHGFGGNVRPGRGSDERRKGAVASCLSASRRNAV